MGETIDALHRLQDVETKLARIREGREECEERIRKGQRRVKQTDGALGEHHRRLREQQARLDALQLEVNAREESINHHRQALNQTKTNRDYAAILTAINTEKADAAKFETQILELMEEVQQIKDETAALEAERATRLEAVQRAESQLARFEEEHRGEFEALQAQRNEIAEHIPPSVLATFDRVAAHHGGEALVPLQKYHPKRQEYMCSGCNMKVTLEVLNALQTRDEIQVCKVCGRILYLEEGTAPTKKSSRSSKSKQGSQT